MAKDGKDDQMDTKVKTHVQMKVDQVSMQEGKAPPGAVDGAGGGAHQQKQPPQGR